MAETLSVLGFEVSLYYLWWFLGAMSVLVYGHRLGKYMGYTFSKSILYVAGTVVLGYLLLWVTSWVFTGGQMNGLNFVRIVTFLPISIFLLARFMKDPAGKVGDFLAPLIAVFHGVTHIGCVFPGCCHGYPSEWGLFSNVAGAVCFPIQPIEVLSSLTVAAVLLFMLRKGVQEGRLYAWYLVLFGGTRFIWEFFRDNEKVLWNISELAFHALAAFFIGSIALVVMNRIHNRGFLNEKNET